MPENEQDSQEMSPPSDRLWVAEAYEMISVTLSHEHVFTYCERRKLARVTNRIRIPPVIRRWSVKLYHCMALPGLKRSRRCQSQARNGATILKLSTSAWKVNLVWRKEPPRRQPCGRVGMPDAIEGSNVAGEPIL